MRASHYSFAHSLSTLLLLFLLLAIAAQVRARPLLAERLRMRIEDYGRSLRPLPLRHAAASPPVMRPCKEMPATAVTTTTNKDAYDEVVQATYSPPPPPPKVSPPTHRIPCVSYPPLNDDLIISMVTDLDFEAPSKSPSPPSKVSSPQILGIDDFVVPSRSPSSAPKMAPPQILGTNDFEAPSKSPPPPPRASPPTKPATDDFEAPSRSPPPAPKVAPPRIRGTNDFEVPPRSPTPPLSQHINNCERTYRSPLPSRNSSSLTHQLTEESSPLIMINSERSPPSASLII